LLVSNIAVASRILWLGRLPTLTDENEIKTAISEQLLKEGQTPVRVEYIASRACAYVTFADRRAAVRAFDKCDSLPFTMRGKTPKVGWSPGKAVLNVGVWDVDTGTTEV
jgi:hypothetical protein